MANAGRSLLIRQSPNNPHAYQYVEVWCPGLLEIADTDFECESAEKFLSHLTYRVRCADPSYLHIFFSRTIDNVPFGLHLPVATE